MKIENCVMEVEGLVNGIMSTALRSGRIKVKGVNKKGKHYEAETSS